MKILLLPISWLYGLFVVLRNACYDLRLFRIRSVGAPVISVGNITVGGTGKTPLVEFLVRRLLDEGLRVAVLSRGYKRSTGGTLVVSDGNSLLATAEDGGDEPYQIALKFPSAIVVVDEVRSRGAALAVQKHGADVVILDDGFQHRQLKRDLDIVLIDAEQPPYRTWLLPAGRRRELIAGLKRASALVISHWSEMKGEEVGGRSRRITRVPQFAAEFRPKELVHVYNGIRRPAEEVRGKRCLAFCGIGRPDSFERMLVSYGADVREFIRFSDHHHYASVDWQRIAERIAATAAEFALTTEKDAVRLMTGEAERVLGIHPLYYVELETHLRDERVLMQLVLDTIGKK